MTDPHAAAGRQAGCDLAAVAGPANPRRRLNAGSDDAKDGGGGARSATSRDECGLVRRRRSAIRRPLLVFDSLLAVSLQ
jgi:hypothetical protein